MDYLFTLSDARCRILKKKNKLLQAGCHWPQNFGKIRELSQCILTLGCSFLPSWTFLLNNKVRYLIRPDVYSENQQERGGA
ncbi:hypothetical protein Y1Q_0006215 [Alligator mississippiensis]|uniref:Uncharacterized protein n=1 Tax=Alligator mississippiensis TaxID=8496 RepID=A0A151NWX8_ALLMI|nr:hypothetical protein Y1Q_0006215 [Alligator mississippiensis]